jgi:hypothetical protein
MLCIVATWRDRDLRARPWLSVLFSVFWPAAMFAGLLYAMHDSWRRGR